jgi:hypothetical protein
MSKVRDETCADEVVLNEQATIRGDWGRIDRLIARYWAEAVVAATTLLLWAPRLSGPIARASSVSLIPDPS